MTVTILEAKQDLDALLDKAEAGESVIITRENKEFEVTPKKKKLRGALGSLKGWKMSDDFNEPLEDMKEYME